MKKHTVFYSVPWGSRDTDPERHECKTSCAMDETSWRDLIARECAEDYHNNHDGWESSWPLTLVLYENEDGPEVARFNVDREMEPVFYARALVAQETA